MSQSESYHLFLICSMEEKNLFNLNTGDNYLSTCTFTWHVMYIYYTLYTILVHASATSAIHVPGKCYGAPQSWKAYVRESQSLQDGLKSSFWVYRWIRALLLSLDIPAKYATAFTNLPCTNIATSTLVRNFLCAVWAYIWTWYTFLWPKQTMSCMFAYYVHVNAWYCM